MCQLHVHNRLTNDQSQQRIFVIDAISVKISQHMEGIYLYGFI